MICLSDFIDIWLLPGTMKRGPVWARSWSMIIISSPELAFLQVFGPYRSSPKYFKSDICLLLSWFVLDIGPISNQYLTTCPPHQKKNPSKFQSNFLILNIWLILAAISICDQYLTCQNIDMSESGPTSL